MSVEMAVWRLSEDGPVLLKSSMLDFEQRLEDMLVADPSMLGVDLLIVGRQVSTSHGGRVDVLALDAEGRVHLLELKRDRTPRDVVAQTLDYGSWASELTLEDVQAMYAEYSGDESTLDEAFAETFDQALPDVVNAEQQFTIVASGLDPTSDRIVEFLAERYGVPINAVFFRHYADGDRSYLARTWLLDPQEAEVKATRAARSKVRPWNGRDFYVILGRMDQGADRWELARKYGLLNAGGGSWYWKPLRNLSLGKRVFAYVGGAGYVGVGKVSGNMIPARDAEVEIDGRLQRLVELEDLPQRFRERARSEDPEATEMVVPVQWMETRTPDQAVIEPGLFASQVTVCKLRDDRTIDALERAFSLGG